ncbi:MAG: hypothetical protein PHT39_04830 [Sphaerochaetaceae bacterium]|nr:hypothetical protein [Sphaerochaetaceae bacterium]
MLTEILTSDSDVKHVTLDASMLLESAKTASKTFCKDNSPPVFKDEIQRDRGCSWK